MRGWLRSRVQFVSIPCQLCELGLGRLQPGGGCGNQLRVVVESNITPSRTIYKKTGSMSSGVHRCRPNGHPLQARRLEQRLELVRTAVLVTNTLAGSADDDDEAFAKNLQVLLDSGVDLPSTTKHRLLARRLTELVPKLIQDQADHIMDELLQALDPFDPASRCTDDNGTKDPVLFDALKPTVGQLDDTFHEKLILTRNIIINDLLRPLIEGGEEMSQAALRLVRSLGKAYEDGVEDLEEAPPSAEEVLLICRALEAILDTSALETNSAAVASMHNASKTESNSSLCDVGLMVRANEFYKKLFTEYLAFATATDEALPGVKSMHDDLDNLPDNSPDLTAKAMSIMEQLPKLRVKMRPGSTYKLERVCQQKLEAYGTFIKSTVKSVDSAEDLKVLENMIKAMQTAMSMWPSAPELAALQVWAKESMADHHNDHLIGELLKVLEPLAVEGAEHKIDSDSLAHVKAAAEACHGMRITGTAQDTLQTFVACHLRRMFQAAPTTTDSAIDVCKLILDLIPGAGSFYIASMERVQVLVKRGEYAMAVKAYLDLGDDDVARFHNDQNMTKLKAVIQNRTAVNEWSMLDDDSDMQGEGWAEFTLKADKLVSDANDVASATTKEKLVAKVSATKLWCLGGPDGASWHSTLAEKTTLNATLDLARNTILTIPAPQYKQAAHDIEILQKSYESVMSIFGEVGDLGVVAEAQTVRRNCMLSFNEGLMCALYQNEHDPKELKKKVKGIKTQLETATPPVKWDDVQVELRTRASNAMKLK